MYFTNLFKPLYLTFFFIIGCNNGLDDVRSTDGEEVSKKSKEPNYKDKQQSYKGKEGIP